MSAGQDLYLQLSRSTLMDKHLSQRGYGIGHGTIQATTPIK